jgi:putative transposase
MKKRFTEGPIVGFLRQADTCVAVKDLCRKHGFSEGSYYLWRSNSGGLSVSHAKPSRRRRASATGVVAELVGAVREAGHLLALLSPLTAVLASGSEVYVFVRRREERR